MSLSKALLHHSQRLLKGAHKTIQNIHKKIIATPDDEKNISLPPPPKDGDARVNVDISLLSAFKIIVLVFATLWVVGLVSQISHIILLFALSLFLSAALHPGVGFLERYKIPRTLGVVILYFFIFGMLIFVVVELLPAIVEQLLALSEKVMQFLYQIYREDYSALPKWAQKWGPQFQELITSVNEYVKTFTDDTEKQQDLLETLQKNTESLQSIAQNLGTGMLSFLSGFIGFVFDLILVLILTFFMVADAPAIKTFFLLLFPHRYQKYIEFKTQQTQEKIAEWVHGQMILFVIVGGVAFIGLKIIGVEYALTLAFLAGLAEFLPYIGPIIAFSTAAPIALGEGFETFFLVMLLYSGIQFVEGNFLVPMVMKRAVGLPPIVTIIAMLIGWEFLGILGIILAVPLATMAEIFVVDYQKREKSS